LDFDEVNASFSGTPENSDVNTPLTLRVKATDSTNLSDYVDVTLNFIKVNDPPYLTGTLDDLRAVRGTLFTKQISTAVFTDPEGDKIYFESAYKITSSGTPYLLPSWLSFDTTTGTFKGTPGPTDVTSAGPLLIELTVSDGQASGGSNEYDFKLFVDDATPVPVQVYQWKTHALLQNAVVKVNGQSLSWSASSPGYPFNYLDSQATLQVTRTDTARQLDVTLKDALAALKLAIGVETINGASQAVSPYQRAAADFDGDGIVTLKDALAILKYSIGVTGTASPEWRFYDEEAIIKGKNLPADNYAKTAKTIPVQANDNLGIVAVLSGDVDGSWTAPADSAVLNTVYFTALVNELKPTDPDVSLARWGIYT
jgi:hypothetical protein